MRCLLAWAASLVLAQHYALPYGFQTPYSHLLRVETLPEKHPALVSNMLRVHAGNILGDSVATPSIKCCCLEAIHEKLNLCFEQMMSCIGQLRHRLGEPVAFQGVSLGHGLAQRKRRPMGRVGGHPVRSIGASHQAKPGGARATLTSRCVSRIKCEKRCMG